MSDYITRLREGYAAYQSAVSESYSRARQAAAEAEQQCASEMFAASGGDDAAERMNSSWLRYQMDTSKLWYELWRDVGSQQRELAATIDELETEAGAAAYEQYLESLRSFGGAAAADKAPTGKPSTRSSTRSSRRRTSGSSG